MEKEELCLFIKIMKKRCFSCLLWKQFIVYDEFVLQYLTHAYVPVTVDKMITKTNKNLTHGSFQNLLIVSSSFLLLCILLYDM
jgi:hypothetical protein